MAAFNTFRLSSLNLPSRQTGPSPLGKWGQLEDGVWKSKSFDHERVQRALTAGLSL